MKTRWLVIVMLCGAFTAAAWADTKANPASPKSDIINDAAIRNLYEQFVSSWNKHDVANMAKMWTIDGDHVEPDGHVAKGRAEVEKLLTAQHQSVFKTSQLKLQIDSIWFITADVALVDGTYEVTGVQDPEGKEIPPRYGRLTSVFLKEGGAWSIAADRLMIPAALPYKKPQ